MKLPWYKRYANWCRKRGTNRIIPDRESKEPYLERFYFIPRWVTLGLVRVVIHKFWKGDTDSAWHDHPWAWGSYVLEGGYWEHTPDPKTGKDRRKWRGPGDFAMRKATALHYIEMDPKHKEIWTLFIMFTPAYREWGFQSFDWKTWTPWEKYLDSKLKESKKSRTKKSLNKMVQEHVEMGSPFDKEFDQAAEVGREIIKTKKKKAVAKKSKKKK